MSRNSNKKSWISNTLIVVVVIATILVVAAVLAHSVNGTPSEENSPTLQTMGIIVLWLFAGLLLVGIFMAGYFLRKFFGGSGGNSASSLALAERSSYKHSRPYSVVKQTTTTEVEQVGAGQTSFPGGKTKVDPESQEES